MFSSTCVKTFLKLDLIKLITNACSLCVSNPELFSLPPKQQVKKQQKEIEQQQQQQILINIIPAASMGDTNAKFSHVVCCILY
jgi:hypothetical protein